MSRNFQSEYDAVRSSATLLAQRNAGAFAQLQKLGQKAIRIAREAEAAGRPVIRRPKGWTK